MAWLTSVTTVARSRASRWREERLENARFRFRLLRAVVSRVDNLPAGFVLAVELMDRDIDWAQQPDRASDWAGI